jgi:tetratricopeptide (TPR) repeat protein
MSRKPLTALIFSLFLTGCGQKERPADVKVDNVVVIAPAAKAFEAPNQTKNKDEGTPKVPAAPLEPAPLFLAAADPASQKYDDAISRALSLLTAQDYAKSLEAFEEAKGEKDTEFVRGEIDKLKARLDADATAVKTIQEIQLVLDVGDPKDAQKLIEQGLHEFGGGPHGARLLQLQAQADALAASGANEDAKARFGRLRDQGQVALRDKNLRAAVAAFQQALQASDDAGLRDQLKEVQDRIERYDSLRRRAAELRRDPNEIDDALVLYRDAAIAWDTPEVRRDIDDCATALQKRRDTLSVADFEILGDLGIPAAGQVVAEELLPTFKTRFDLVERGQVEKLIEELDLADGIQNNPDQQRELGKLARVRFLVLGSVRRLGDVTVQARLVDTTSGLIVQTAKISAPSFEQVLPRLPELTRQLLMSDEEKVDFDQVQIQAAQRIEPAPEQAPLPPPPPPQGQPIGANVPWLAAAPPPPAFGNLRVAQFQALPQAPAVVPQVVIVEPPAATFRARLVRVVVEQGDGFFVHRQYLEAYRQYEFALSLAPHDFAIRARLDACRPLLPPVVVVQQVVVRPRLAILNFMVVGDPRVVPPGLSVAAPNLLAPYFRRHYDLVDSREVFWMMGRLGMTQFDLMNDPNARRWLGRALHAQFFLMGTVEQTASFDVSTYLLNAEQGWLQGSGRVHVRNAFELKVRAGELAHVTQLPAAQRAQFLVAQPEVNTLLLNGQANLNRGNFQVAITLFQNVLQVRPGNVQALVYLNQAQHARRQHEIEEARRKEFAQREATVLAARRRQLELAQAAEAARLAAAQRAAARADAERRALAQQRANAYADMVAKGRGAAQAKNFTVAVNLFQGALDLALPAGASAPVVPLPVPQNVLVNELAQARAEVARANEQKVLAERAAAQESALRQQREKDLAAARQKIADDARKAEAAALAQRKVNDAKYQAAFDQGQLLVSQGKFEAAIVALQGARQLKRSPDVEKLLNTALTGQAKVVAQTKGDVERKALEEKLAAERVRAEAAEVEAKRNRDFYEAALKSARLALAQKKLDLAESEFKAAGKLFNNDAVLTGLKQVQAARAMEAAATKASLEKANLAKRTADLLAEGKTAFDAGRFADSVLKLEQARKLEPSNVDVLAALSRAEHARDRAAVEQKQKAADIAKAAQSAKEAQAAKDKAAKIALEEETKKAVAAKQRAIAVAQAVDQGQKALLAKNYPQAIKSYQEALRLEPGQLQAIQGLQQAQAALAAAQKTADADRAAKEKAAKLAQEDELKKALVTKQQKAAAVAQAVDQGQKALLAKNYPQAIKSYQEALRLEPGQPQATQGLQQAQAALAAAQKTADADRAAKEKAAKLAQEDELKKAIAAKQQKAAAVAQAVDQGQKAFLAKNYPQAIKSYQEALRLEPGQPQATQGLQQAQAALALANQQQIAEQKKKMSYADAIKSGQALLNQKKFAEAVQAFQAAKNLYPADPQANQLLTQTNQAWDAAKKTPVPPVKNEPPKVNPLKVNPLKVTPPKSDPPKKVPPPEDAAKKKEAETRAQYQALMAKGQQLLAQRQFAAAAQQFEAALRVMPGDPVALKLLQQAKTSKK